jgi:hypothetical protein
MAARLIIQQVTLTLLAVKQLHEAAVRKVLHATAEATVSQATVMETYVDLKYPLATQNMELGVNQTVTVSVLHALPVPRECCACL